MTISSTTNRNDYTGAGSTATYPYTFYILHEDDLLVTVRDTAGTETTLVIDDDYTVSGVGASSGGNIVLVDSGQSWLDGSSFLDTGIVLTIRRVRDITQTFDIRNQGPYYPATQENAFDSGIMVAQQLQDQLDRSLKAMETDFTEALYLPLTDDRAGQYLGFDSDGLPIAAAGVSSDVMASSFMQTVLDDTSAAAARATLGISDPFIDALNYGSGTYDDTTISAALTAIGSDNRILLLRVGTWTIAHDLTIPANVTLFIMDGALLTVSSTKTLTIVGDMLGSKAQRFSGSGTVSFANNTKILLVYPEWWGAIGDGSTDCTTAFTACFTTNVGSGRIIQLGKPSSSYKITSAMQMPDKCTLAGNNSKIYQATANSSCFYPGNDCEIYGLIFTGTGTVSTLGRGAIKGDPGGTGTASNRVYIHHCKFETTLSTCAICGDYCIDWRIENNHIELNNNGEHGIYISTGGSHVWIKNNYISNTVHSTGGTWGINIKGSSSMFIENNIITGYWDYGIVMSTTNSSDNYIRHNVLSMLQTSSMCIRLGSSSVDTRMFVEHNYINANSASDYGVYSQASRVIIRGNYVVDAAARAIEVDGASSDSSETYIVSNVCKNSHGGIKVTTADADTYVCNNFVKGTGAYIGIQVTGGSTSALVANNVSVGFNTSFSIDTACMQYGNSKDYTSGPTPGNRYKSQALAAAGTFTAEDGGILILTGLGGSNRNFNPSGTFPAGYEVIVVNQDGANTIAFDSSGINITVGTTQTGHFVYSGAAWVKLKVGATG